MLPWQPIKFSDLDKFHMTRRGLLKKHFCRKKNLNICSETAKLATFHFSHYKSLETKSCHSNQSSYPIGTKNIILSPHLQMLYVKYGKNRLHGFRGEVFENVDGRATDACTPPPPKKKKKKKKTLIKPLKMLLLSDVCSVYQRKPRRSSCVILAT